MCQHAPNTTEYQRKTHLKTQTPPRCHESGRTSTGPTEAINGRLEYLRGIALGFRTLTHYTIRSLIHIGRLKDRLTTTT